MSDSTYSTNGGKTQALDYTDARGGVDLLDAGLRYISRGWKIFAVNGKKEPLGDIFPHGHLSATTDDAVIRACALKYPGANWALAVPEGMLVVDLDVKRDNNGIREFERLQGCKPEDFVAPRVRTGTGGIHLYLDPNGHDYQNTRSRIAPGIDTRAAGAGYVVLPRTVILAHPSPKLFYRAAGTDWP
jgi:hypothetical protein